MICFVIYEVNNKSLIFMSVKEKFNFLKKKKLYDILVNLVDFCGKFP